MSKQIIDSALALDNTKDLLRALKSLSQYPDETAVEINGESVRLDLEEERLSDGSFVYTILISGHRRLNKAEDQS